MQVRQLQDIRVELVPVPSNGHGSYFVTLFKDSTLHFFSLERVDGSWAIRNPDTVPDFIRAMEKELVSGL